MGKASAGGGDGIHLVDGCLIVSVSREPDEAELQGLRDNILAKIEAAPVRGVLLDVSQVRVLDTFLFGLLHKTGQMARLLGKETVYVGFQAGIASSLIDLDIDPADLSTALSMEDGLAVLHRGAR